jgi:hypothetical protein
MTNHASRPAATAAKAGKKMHNSVSMGLMLTPTARRELDING